MKPSLTAVAIVLAATPAGAASLQSHDAKARPLLAQMTLAEKIGQMTQGDLGSLKDEDVEGYFLGSVLSGGDSDPGSNSFAEWRAAYERVQARTRKTRLRIPLLYGIDAVHGNNNVIGATVFPHNIGLGATRNAKLVEEAARVTAREMRATGVEWAFAPAVMVPRDERWGRAYEGFAEDPALVAELGAAAVRGFQGKSLAGRESVLACAKHFVGDGGTSFGTGLKDPATGQALADRGDTRLSETELRRIHLPGYPAAIKEGVGSIMVSYNAWNGAKASGSHRLMTEILKGELGFEGFLISDWDAIDELPGDYRAQVKASVLAGMDMFMVPQKYRLFYTTLKDLVEKGEVPMSRIDDAVLRILRVKAAMGLLDPGRPLTADRGLEASFGSRAHREVARSAVRESLVLLKNEGGVLPLKRTAKRIHVAGRGADDLGRQAGGWTITWQGRIGPSTTGTTILGAILQAVPVTTQVTYSKDGSGAAGADAAVVVVGEEPYAEMRGDRADLALAAEDQETIARVKAAGVPTAVVLLSGRPMVLGDSLSKADAFVAAWLPGSEGQGVADVLFGDWKPTGKLSYSWPRSTDQIPINVGDPKYDPLFAFGYGLSY